MLSPNRIAACAVCVAFVLSSRAHASVIDLTSGTSGSIRPSQSYNETRGLDVTIFASSNLYVQAMTLTGFHVGPDAFAQVGARIYSSPTATLLASATTTITSDHTITLAISATLHPGSSYRICFFGGPVGGTQDNSGDLFDPDPSGAGGFPYGESSGNIRVNGAYDALGDVYPGATNSNAPRISLDVLTRTDVPAASPATVPATLGEVKAGFDAKP